MILSSYETTHDAHGGLAGGRGAGDGGICHSQEGVPRVALKEAFQKPEAGTFIPKTVIVDPEVTRVIAFVPYGNPGEMNKALSKAKKAVAHTFIPGSGSRSGAARSSRPGSKPKPASPAPAPEE